ncbi:outer membrane lipoprotein-sorting protein [Archaeoglobus sp.]
MSFSGEKPQFDYGMIVKGMIENYNIRLLGEESVDNRECYVIEAEPKSGGAKMRMWVDREFWYPMRTEMSIEGITTVVEYRNVSFNSGLDDNLFEYIPPEGVKIVEKKLELPKKLAIDEAQQRVNFTIIVPSYTAGYEFDYAVVYGDFVQLVYTKGDDRLVITESLKKSPLGLNWSEVDVNGRRAEIAEMLETKILRINVNGVEVVISAKLGNEEFVKIAESMV